MSRRILNGIGAIVVVILFVAGIAFVAVPIVLDAVATSASTIAVAGANAQAQAQVAALREDEARRGEITARVDALRAEIPAAPHSDEVFDIVSQAATATGATVVSVVAAAAVPWTPRTQPSGGEEGSETGDGTSGDAEADPSGDPPGDQDVDASGDQSVDGTAGAGPEGGEPTADDDHSQVPYTIQVRLEDPATAAQFMDALRIGPRLLGIVNSTLLPDSGGLLLTVSALAFVRTG